MPAAAFAIAALLVNIFERKQEAGEAFFRVTAIGDKTGDPARWGENFPLHSGLWRRTVARRAAGHQTPAPAGG